MIGPAQFVNGIWMGMVLIALGLIPGLFESLTDCLRKILGTTPLVPIPSRWQTHVEPVQFKRQPWLVVVGAMILAVTFVVYFAN